MTYSLLISKVHEERYTLRSFDER